MTGTYTPMIQQYLTIKANYQDAFLFFRLGDFYELFFEDAEKAAQILEITLTGRDGGTNKRIPMCGVPYHSAENYIQRLIEQGNKVAICEQVQDPKEAKGVVKREVIKVITPGTIMEGKAIQTKGNNYIASLYMDHDNSQIGLAVSDISTGEFYCTEIIGNIEDALIELAQYNPSEILIGKTLYNHLKVNFQTFRKVTITTLADELVNNDELCTRLFQNQFGKVLIPFTSVMSSGMILHYLQNTQQRKINHFSKIEYYDTKKYMILDSFTRKNLELTETARDQSKKGSLIWLLDKTETAMGTRLLKRWLEKPLLSVEKIEERLERVEALVQNVFLAEDLKHALKHVYDIERLISRISFGNATPKDLYALRRSLEKVPSIYQLIEDSGHKALIELTKELDFCADVQAIIENSIVEEPPLTIKEGGIIKRGFHEQLDLYYQLQNEGKEWLQELERKERDITGIKSLKVRFNKVFGYYIEITKSNLNQVPSGRYIRKQTLANAERYITEELKEKEAQILEADEKIYDLEYEVFVAVREKIAVHSKRLQELAKQIATIDVLLAFSVISTEYDYVRPKINQDGIINISNGRHPVIEAVQKDIAYIPNNVQLDNNINEILLITGPNMSGKSTYMRQIAISVIMAQMGCFVPAENANISITDRIFTRIGAGDDLTSGYSTFMVEMLETKLAITQATQKSLILLDEIGRGTSTYDGMAIAQAIIEHIHDNVQAKTLFSTHYHELTDLDQNFERIQNVHVNVIEKNGKVIFLHKIEKGKADKSYGIHVAELAGLPSSVIENAKRILANLEEKGKKQTSNEVQLALFTDEVAASSSMNELKPKKQIHSEAILDKIKSLDLLNMTPMEGFQLLYEIQKEIRK